MTEAFWRRCSIAFGVRISGGTDHRGPVAAPKTADPGLCAKHVLCSWRFWSIALPFALALAALVGLIVHLVSFLLPRLGATGAATALSLISLAAVGGRLALAGVVDRLHQRRGELRQSGRRGGLDGWFHAAARGALCRLRPIRPFGRQRHCVPGADRRMLRDRGALAAASHIA